MMKNGDKDMIDFRQARQIVLAQSRSFGSEELPLERAFGRVLTGVIRADRDYPPFNRATMDGYAVRYRDLEAGIRSFRVVETLFAGDPSGIAIGKGECYKIMTGAAVPADADLVIRREDVAEPAGSDSDGSEISVKDVRPEPWHLYLNIARRGEDLRAGAEVIGRPCRCEPAVMGLLATLGQTKVTVARLPRVAVVTTGNEVVEAGAPAGPVQIRNSNRWMLEAALRREGVEPAACKHAADEPALLRAVLAEQLGADLLVVTGGVSAGDADHVPAVLESLGVRRLFHRIAMRPGKPVWCGVMPGGGMVFALPGNPFSCLVNFTLLISSYLHRCWGLETAEPVGLPLGSARAKRTVLDEFFPVRVAGQPARLVQLPLNGSGDIRMGMQATALALHPAESGDLAAGAAVACYSLV